MTKAAEVPGPTSGRTLTIDFSVRLPDCGTRSRFLAEYERYGRFAILYDGTLWCGDEQASHPANTRDGFYWACKQDTLLLSPRGTIINWPHIISGKILSWLLVELHLSRRYHKFVIIGSTSELLRIVK